MPADRLRALLAAPLALATAAAAPAPEPTPAPRAVAAALAGAAAFCEQVVRRRNFITIPSGGEAYKKSFKSPAGGFRPLSDLPELVSRFAATQTIGRHFSLSDAVRFPATDGEAWAVIYDGMPACDVMVTGAGGVPAIGAALASQPGLRLKRQLVGLAPPGPEIVAVITFPSRR